MSWPRMVGVFFLALAPISWFNAVKFAVLNGPIAFDPEMKGRIAGVFAWAVVATALGIGLTFFAGGKAYPEEDEDAAWESRRRDRP